MTILHTILAGSITGINHQLNSINRGGCGHYAYELGQALAEHNIDSSIVLAHHGWCGENEDDVAQFIKDVDGAFDITSAIRIRYANGRLNGRYVNPCFSHICLKVDDVLYDADGVHNNRAISDAIEPDAMELALRGGTWNPAFEYGNEDDVLDTMRTYIRGALAPLGEG